MMNGRITSIGMALFLGVGLPEAQVLVVDPSARSCLNCTPDVDPDGIVDVASKCTALDVDRWFATRLIRSTTDHTKISDPETARRTFDSLTAHEFCFDHGAGTVCYELRSCRLWDCYRSFLSRYDACGTRVWRRRVPHLDLLVHPFLHEGDLLYLSNDLDAVKIVVVNFENGRVRKVIAVPREVEDLYAEVRVPCFPAAVGEYVAIQGRTRDGKPPMATNIFVVRIGLKE
jgi:hypothetical protein